MYRTRPLSPSRPALYRAAGCAALSLALLLTAGCQRVMSGPKTDDAAQIRPDKITDFDTLYNRNCAGCHGAEGKNGPSIALNNPVYLTLVTDDQLRNILVNGQPGTLMPAFGTSAGGLLTDEQLNAIIAGMRQRWSKAMPGLNPPPYLAHTAGDVAHGEQVYAAGCAGCHGAVNAQGSAVTQGGASGQNGVRMPGAGSAPSAGKAGSIIDPTFLALLSDQSLRTIVIAGRPDLGQPDWRSDIPGRPLSDQEVTDVVAWLASHRSPLPGQTHPDPAHADPSASELQRRVQ